MLLSSNKAVKRSALSNSNGAHPNTTLCYRRSYDTMLDQIAKAIDPQPLTVPVIHWWEYFRNNIPPSPLS
jgi:hypothetical protein